MKSFPARILLPLTQLAMLLSFFGSKSAPGTPVPSLAIARGSQGVVLSWFASSEVLYQLQASTDLGQWGNIGSQINGNGSTVAFQFPTLGQGRFFFRLKLPGIQTATFDPANGVLNVIADSADNIIVVTRDSSGRLLINNGEVEVTGGMPTVGNTSVIKIYGRDGADQIMLNEANGPLPHAELYGEGGNDILSGGSGDDLLDGGPGDDTLFGQAGVDVLHGGDNNDTLSGGDGDDQVFGDAGNDRLVWMPGDDTDLNEGGDGSDTVEVNGENDAEVFTTTANGTRVRFDRLNPAPFFLDINACEFLVLSAKGGNDKFSAIGNLASLIAITVDGGAGDDLLLGSNGPDVLIGGEDNDFVDGQQGNDMIYLGDGDDTVQWDPGDGSDTVEGQTGNDRLLFNGSNANENIAVSANGARARLTRDIAAIVMDLDDVETLQINLIGGADNLTVNDLAGTDVAYVTAQLLGSNGIGDGAVDNIFINGTAGADIIKVSMPDGAVTVTGLATRISVEGFEPANDSVRLQGLGGDDILDASTISSGAPAIVLEGGEGSDTIRINGEDFGEVFATTANGTRVRFDRLSPAPFFLDINGCELLELNANGGNDQFSATGNLAALISIRVDGGTGDDILLGGNGSDTLIGGDNNDFIDGNQGNDMIFLGHGDDTFQWDPGDGNDTVEGQAGHDIILFNASNAGESCVLSANGARLRFTRNIGNVVLDADDVEQFDLRLLGSVDNLTVNDLTGTDLAQLNVDLAGTFGGSTGDGAADGITVNGTNAPDNIGLSANSGVVEIAGLAAQVRILHPEVANDSLIVNGLGGADTFNIGVGVTSLIQVTTNQ